MKQFNIKQTMELSQKFQEDQSDQSFDLFAQSILPFEIQKEYASDILIEMRSILKSSNKQKLLMNSNWIKLSNKKEIMQAAARYTSKVRH